MKQNDIEKICDKIDSLTEVLVLNDDFSPYIEGIDKRDLLELKEFIRNINKENNDNKL
jgi:hypothetical protein